MSGARPGGGPRPLLVAGLGIGIVTALAFSAVEPTNFGGWDEWLMIELASRGVLALPYHNRPLALLFHVPAAAAAEWLGLAAFQVTQILYLAGVGVTTFLLVRRLRGGGDAVALLAGVLAATWAPMDGARLNVVLTAGYAGRTLATMLALLLLVESWRSGSRLGLVLASALGFAALRMAEATAGLLVAGPGLLWLAEGPSGSRRRFALVFWSAVGLALVLAALPLLPGSAPTYQTAGLGIDPRPWAVAERLARQALLHVGPVLTGVSRDTLSASAIAATAAFAVLWAFWWRSRPVSPPGSARSLAILCGVGLAGALAGWSVQALSPAMTTPLRTQFLSAPGVGILLASLVGLACRPAPGRWRGILAGALGAWIVAVGAGRTTTMQREWDEATYWPLQSRCLRSLTELAPGLKPGTLVIALDEAGAWPASFTFRHAIQYLYRGATGWAPGGNPYLYPARLTPAGLVYEPWPLVRSAWRMAPSLHGYDQMVVLRVAPGGRATLERRWPAGDLPPLPEGATYAPGGRILHPAHPPRRHAILR